MTEARTLRLRALAGLIRDRQVASQEEATARLRALGFTATQATVSRDLDRLGALKVKQSGRLLYALPDQIGATDWSAERLNRIFADWVISAEAAGTLIVIKTPPGSAHLVASAIDGAHLGEVAGTVSGDDTLFVALRDAAQAASLLNHFQGLIGREESLN